MKIKVVLSIALILFLGPAITYASGYSLHTLDPNDWYTDGFPLGWKKVEGTSEGSHPPTFTFFNPTRFVLDALFWCCIVLVIVIVSISLAHVFRRYIKT